MLSFGIVSLLMASSLLPIAPSFYAPPTNTFVTFRLPAALIVMAAIGLDDVRTRGQPWQSFQEIGNPIVGICIYRFFERPIGSILNRWISPKPVA